MIAFLSGLVVTGAGGASLWYFKPRDGQMNVLALKPVLDFLIPIGIVTTLAVGIALIVDGIVG
jgi:hypothetical protein